MNTPDDDRLIAMVAEDTTRTFREYPDVGRDFYGVQVELLALRAKEWLDREGKGTS